MIDKELHDTIEHLAEECQMVGHNNFAIVLYSYLGAKKSGTDGLFASHCQEFSKKGLKAIDKMREESNRRY